ncbi:MAG: adenine methyltransferase, partial [Mesorhizobium sp.]
MSVNLFAGMGSHQSARSETNTWFSPPDILDALGG